MHAQQFALHRQNLYPALQGMNPVVGPSQHFATHNNFGLAGFSRGSSLCHAYRQLPDRGGPSARISPSFAPPSINATGLAISDTPSQTVNVFRPEGIANYQQPWQWMSNPVHGHAAPMSAPLDPNLSAFKNSILNPAGVVRSPTAQLPTPAAMAVLLNPSARSEITPSFPPPFPIPETDDSASNSAAARPVSQSQFELGRQSTAVGPSRERKHACTMCHKRFDRPSTLRKHLLVHTGEKAFVCGTCGRRFGVASNLNRHVRRCILKPVNQGTVSSSPESATESPFTFGGTHPGASASAVNEYSASLRPTKDVAKVSVTGKQHKRARTSSSYSSPSTPSNQARARTQATTSKAKEPTVKRRRRAPSPSRWIPLSLLGFNLTPDEFYKSTPVPLPPATPSYFEERDSWDENVSAAPYHPSGWKNRLPGPGLGLGLGLRARNMRNLDLVNSGGVMRERVVVF